MKVDGKPYRTIWLHADGSSVEIIDQTRFPHVFETVTLRSVEDAAHAIRHMLVRGAPLIGAAAAYGMALAARRDGSDTALREAYDLLHATRPTAINLKWALDEMMRVLRQTPPDDREKRAYRMTAEICDDDVEINRAIGRPALDVLRKVAGKKRP